jgi:hypothetical protein
VPIGATDAASFSDPAPLQHAELSYVVRAVDTNGNETDSAPALIQTPDWTPPAAPLPKVTAQGTNVTVTWPAAGDNVGVVGYDVLRDEVQVESMTAAVRTYRDTAAKGVKTGVHTWRVRARDAAGLSATSEPQSLKITKPVVKVSLVAVHMVGGKKARSGALHYALGGRARLLVDVRIVGTVPKAKLRLYVKGGRGRITIWRGTPGSSATRLRLGSALARPGYVTVNLKRALHTGRVRLVVIASGHLTLAGSGAHKPKMKAG